LKIIFDIVNQLGVSQNQNNGKKYLMQLYPEILDKATQDKAAKSLSNYLL